MTDDLHDTASGVLPDPVRFIVEKALGRQGNLLESDGRRQRGPFSLEEILRAYRPDQPVVWSNIFGPRELFYAMDVVPFLFDAAGVIVGLLEMTEVIDRASTMLPSRDTCTFIRAGLGGTLLGLLPEPNAIVCTSCLCEGAMKAAYAAGKSFGREYHLLDVPEDDSAEAVDYVAGQLRHLGKVVSDAAGTSLDEDRLAEVIALSNEAREYLLKIAELRKRVPAPCYGGDLIGSALIAWGTQSAVDSCRVIYEDLESVAGTEGTAVAGKQKVRLVWLHLKPFYSSSILDYLEKERGATIVFDLFSAVTWPPMNPGDPYRSLARKTIAMAILDRFDVKKRFVTDMVREFRADGVVQFSPWGCRWNCGGARITKDTLQQHGIPFVNLDGDCVDPRSSNEAQIRARLEAFLDVLEEGLR